MHLGIFLQVSKLWLRLVFCQGQKNAIAYSYRVREQSGRIAACKSDVAGAAADGWTGWFR
jgi:hypothetical protein